MEGELRDEFQVGPGGRAGGGRTRGAVHRVHLRGGRGEGQRGPSPMGGRGGAVTPGGEGALAVGGEEGVVQERVARVRKSLTMRVGDVTSGVVQGLQMAKSILSQMRSWCRYSLVPPEQASCQEPYAAAAAQAVARAAAELHI